LNPQDVFLHFTATGWTAIGSIATAVSIIALSCFNVFYLIAARKQASAAEQTLGLLQQQMVMSERPFVAIHAHYDEAIQATAVYAHNQGIGPALDVVADLLFKPGGESERSSYGVGCLAVDEKFRFLIGAESGKLISAIIGYKSISGQWWQTKVSLIGGNPSLTEVHKLDE
jgi:hypothetical protein